MSEFNERQTSLNSKGRQRLRIGYADAALGARMRSADQGFLASLPDIRIASHRDDLCSAQMVSATMRIGTPMKAPATPHRKLQKKTANSTMNGDSDNCAPAMRGSR